MGRFHTHCTDRCASATDRQERLGDFPVAHPGRQLDSLYSLDGKVFQGLRRRKRLCRGRHHHHNTHSALIHCGHSGAGRGPVEEVQFRRFIQVHSLILRMWSYLESPGNRTPILRWHPGEYVSSREF